MGDFPMIVFLLTHFERVLDPFRLLVSLFEVLKVEFLIIIDYFVVVFLFILNYGVWKV